MRLLMIFVILVFLNCGSRIQENDVLIINEKKSTEESGRCNFVIYIDKSLNITLYKFPCDFFDVGDTINLYD